VLGLSANQTFSQKAFADYLKLNFPLLSDADLNTIKSYGVQNGTVAQRSYFIIDRGGVLRYKKILVRGEGLVPNEALLDEVKKIHAQNPV
jgi:thioredoxin-dependent peroxiredoxin